MRGYKIEHRRGSGLVVIHVPSNSCFRLIHAKFLLTHKGFNYS